MLKRVIGGVATVAIVVAHAPCVEAGKDSEKDRQQRSRVLLKEGQSKYDLGKFDEAIVLFAQAYEIWPYPEALYNLGQAWRRKKDYDKAIFYFKAYLRNAPDAANRQEVEDRIGELKNLLAQQESSGEKPPTGVQVPPGGGTGATPGQALPGTTMPSTQSTLAVSPQPSASLSVTDSPWYADGWGWGTAGAGLITLGVGGYVFMSARDLHRDAEAASSESERRALTIDADGRENVATVVTIGGIAVLLVGVALLAWNPEKTSKRGVQTSFAPGWLGVSGEF